MSVLLLPFITCFFWIVLNPLVHKRDKALRAVQALLAITGISVLAMVELALANESHIALPCFFIRQFFTPLIIPSAILYLHAIEDKDRTGSFLLVGIVISVSLLFAEIILLGLSGIDGFNAYLTKDYATSFSGTEQDKIWQLIHLCSIWIFYGILALETLWFAVSAIVKSAKKQFAIQKYNLCAFILLYIVIDVLSNKIPDMPSWLIILESVLLSASIFAISYTSIFHNKTDLSISDLLKGLSEYIPEQNNMEKVRIAAISQIDDTEPTNDITDIRQTPTDEEYLKIKFEDLIITEKLFLRQGIRLSDIASMLETNRTYVSRLVNNTYDMSFSDYINTLRIDYAKQYLLNHRDAKQSDIATACGFPNASAFNNVFKKTTGVTPKIWLATQS